jgi:uncharacterized protein YkwD
LTAVSKFRMAFPIVLSLVFFWRDPIIPDQVAPSSLQAADVFSIEKDLFEMVNQERIDQGLDPLRLSQELTRMARSHSQDMASRMEMTHLSVLGKSYLERLVDAGFYFRNIGENVAVSETFHSDFIHQGFMESPEHRENILDPEFEEIGIGVIYSRDKKYYVTQDFMHPLKVLEDEEAEKIIREEIDRLRKEKSLPPLSYQKAANVFARSFSEKKASGKPLMNIGSILGETHIHFITTPELDIPENISKEVSREVYEAGGVGVWFGRLDNYPGGTYLITLFFFPVDEYKGLKEQDLVEIVLEAMNEKRKEKGLKPLKLDNGLSKEASHVSSQLRNQERGSNFPLKARIGMEVFSYVTEAPESWPDNLEQIILSPGLRKLGIGISVEERDSNFLKKYWVTLIFGDHFW